MKKKDSGIKTYQLWYAGEIKNIKESVEKALEYFQKNNFKILSIEVSKLDCSESFSINNIIVIPKKEVSKNHIYLEMENKNVES